MTGKQFAKVLKSKKHKFPKISTTAISEVMDELVKKYNLKHFCFHKEPWIPGKPLLKYNGPHSKNGYIAFGTTIYRHGVSKLIELLETCEM
jgi:hypothetical protein